MTSRWPHITLEVESTFTPEDYLTHILRTFYDVYSVAYRLPQWDSPKLLALVWIEPEGMLTNRDVTAPIASIHILPVPTYSARKYYTLLTHKIIGQAFEKTKYLSLLMHGTRLNNGWRVLQKLPYGKISWSCNSLWHPKLGMTDTWDWSVLRSDYDRMKLKEAEKEVHDVVRRQESKGSVSVQPFGHLSADGTGSEITPLRKDPVWYGRIRRWLHLS